MNHVLAGLAANPSLPPHLVDRLIAVTVADAGPDADGDADGDLARELAARADLSHAQAVALAARVAETAVPLAHAGRLTAADIDPVSRPSAALALLDAGTGDPGWARLFAASPVVEHREKLAACPGLPAEVVATLAADTEVRVVAELALWTDSVTAARLAGHPHAEVRSAVAANEATPAAALAALLTGEGLPPAERCLVCDVEPIPFVHAPGCPRVGCALRPGDSCDGAHESTLHELYRRALSNPATPAAAVTGFVDHPSMLLREQLAARPDLPQLLHGRLAQDPCPGVRAKLAGNPAIDEALIRLLATDRGHDVQRSLAHHPEVPLDVVDRLAGTARTGSTLLPRIAAATAAEIRELAASPNPALRMLLAERHDLPADVRDALAADSDAKVLKSVARHPGLTDTQLLAMVDRHGARVLAKVAAAPDASPALLERLVQQVPPVQKAFREVARQPCATPTALLACLADHQAAPIAAAHPSLPPRTIVDLLTHEDGRVVEAAAANPSLPPTVMAQLVSQLTEPPSGPERDRLR